jgi:hypothetical protein
MLLDKVLTYKSEKEAWFAKQFKKDEQIYYDKIDDYIERLSKGGMTSAFPKGVKIHPLSMLLINAGIAFEKMKSRSPFLYWRSYGSFLFWVRAIYETSCLKGFREKISGKKNIIGRLRHPDDFCGAMFEVLMACCLQHTCLFDIIAFGDDPPDLILLSKGTSPRYALECKMLSGLTKEQGNMKKLGNFFFDRVMSYLRNTPLPVYVWWVFDRLPNDADAAVKAAKAAIDLCEARKTRRYEIPTQELELGEELGRLIVCDLPEELTFSEDKTGDPRPSTWYPDNVPKGGETYCDRQTQIVNGERRVPVRILVYLTQRFPLKANLTANLDYARKKQLRLLDSAENKKIVAVGLRKESDNKFKEVKQILSEYLIEHGELTGIIAAVDPNSATGCSVVECSDFARIGLNSSFIYLSSVSLPEHPDNLPFSEIQVFLQDEKRIICHIDKR